MEGNQKKMREALLKARKAICHHAEHICQSLSWENSDIQSNCADVLCAHRELCEAKTAINVALSAPPRNCDVGTAEEQWSRFEKMCFSSRQSDDPDYCSCKCKVDGGCVNDCALIWAQMPYEAEEGAGK